LRCNQQYHNSKLYMFYTAKISMLKKIYASI
jgi:hypothetical protein